MKTYKEISRREMLIDVLFLLHINHNFSNEQIDELVKELEDWEKVEYPKEWFKRIHVSPQ